MCIDTLKLKHYADSIDFTANNIYVTLIKWMIMNDIHIIIVDPELTNGDEMYTYELDDDYKSILEKPIIAIRLEGLRLFCLTKKSNDPLTSEYVKSIPLSDYQPMFDYGSLGTYTAYSIAANLESINFDNKDIIIYNE